MIESYGARGRQGLGDGISFSWQMTISLYP
jgi:hypothetical protein